MLREQAEFKIPDEIHRAVVHAVTNQLGFDKAISYELDSQGRLWTRHAKGINPEESFYCVGQFPVEGKVFDVAIKEKKHQIILDPHLDPRCHPPKIELYKGKPFAVIPVEVNDTVAIVISVNNEESSIPLEDAKIEEIINLSRTILAPVFAEGPIKEAIFEGDSSSKKVKKNVLEKKLCEYVEEIENVQIGTILRTSKDLDIKGLKQKALLAYLTISAQNKKGIYPYNRFLKKGSQTYSAVISPDESKEKNCIVWCNNHYLGLNRNAEVLRYAKQILDEYGSGCGTSAASGGFNSIHKVLESELAKFEGKEEAVLYPTGYTTNTGVIGTLISPGDLIIVDRDSHASVIDGMKMAGAEFRVLKHLDVNHLEDILKKVDRKKYNDVFVLTESVFSMSGEEAPLEDYCKLKQKYGFFLYVDEAHAFGFYGEKGGGLCEHVSQTKNIEFIMSTLSKATASIGGFVAGDKHYCAYLRINSNPYLFQACLTPIDAAVCVAALRVIQSDKSPREKLWEKTNKFRKMLKNKGFNVGGSKSPIVPVYVSDETKLALFCRELYQNGIFTNWISYPAVRKHMGRLRFIVTANHTDEQIERTVWVLEKIAKQMGVI